MLKYFDYSHTEKKKIIEGEQGQYHSYRWPGSLHCQDISSYDIDYVG